MADMMNMDGSGWDADMFDDIFGDVPDKVALAVFLIDRSGSMDGTVLGTVNSILEEVLADLSRNEIKIAIAQIDQCVAWNASYPVEAREYRNWDRIQAGDLSNMGEAFMQLGKKLEDRTWCPVGKHGIEGTFILFSDGMATDHYESGLNYLKSNKIFQDGKKLAVNFSVKKDIGVLLDFAGSQNNFVDAGNKDIRKITKHILSLIIEN